jgi:hypothetical protein
VDSLARLYIAWQEDEAGESDVRLSWSDDGVSFAESMRIGDDSAAEYDQQMPDLVVTPDGGLALVWVDFRSPSGMYFARTI